MASFPCKNAPSPPRPQMESALMVLLKRKWGKVELESNLMIQPEEKIGEGEDKKRTKMADLRIDNASAPIVQLSPHATHEEKPEKFNGVDFKRWQQKIFYLTTLNLNKFLTEALFLEEGEMDITTVASVKVWKHSNFLCTNYILNALDNTLYNVYNPIKTAKDLWESLDRNIALRMLK